MKRLVFWLLAIVLVLLTVDGAMATAATGGTMSTFSNATSSYTVHTFLTNGTLSVTESGTVTVLVVAGGGGGGYDRGSGGGAGGLIYNNSYSVTAGQNISVVVGNGGRHGQGGSTPPLNGENSTFGTLNANGGGAGGSVNATTQIPAKAGGSGGGGYGQIACTGGSATPAGQGNAGGNGNCAATFTGGGGGGAGGVGGNGGASAGIGGVGINYSINGSVFCYAGGGGSTKDGGAGGAAVCGGGAGSNTGVVGVSGTNGTGGGGGGGGNGQFGGRGGSGIVIIQYETSPTITITLSLSNLVNGSSWPSTVTFNNASGNNLTGVLDFLYHNITGTGFCVTYTGNGTGTNCTATGSGTSTFFNVSNNSVTITGSQTVRAATYQAILNVSAYRLFLNNSILSFNTTAGTIAASTITGNVSILALNGSTNVKIDVAGNYSKNVTCTVSAPLSTATCNATGIYDDLFTIGAKYAGSGISSFNVTVTNDTLGGTLTTVSTSTGNATIPLLQGYWYYFLINAPGYALGNTTIPANASTNLYNFTLYRAQSIQLLIKDEITRDLLNATFTLELINDQEANNYTTSNGTFYIDLVIPEDYTFRYRATDYPERDYYSTIATQSTNNITLYAISFNESDDVLVTVTSTSGFPIEDATVKLLRYYVYCNCYEVVEMAKTSYAGVAFFNAQYYEGHYKWSVDYQGTNYFISETPEVLVPEEGEITVTRTIVINLGTDYYSQYVDLTDTGYVCTYNATSGGLSFTWSDTSGLVTQGCLDAQVLNGVNYESIGVNCQSAATGGVVQTTNTSRTYKYEAYLVVDGETTSVCAGVLNQDPGYDFGDAGVFLAMGIIITLVLAFSYSAIGVLVITAAGIIIVNMLGLMTFTGSFISGFAVLVIGLAVYVMRS